jgi:AcrR family transcriptional regulator
VTPVKRRPGRPAEGNSEELREQILAVATKQLSAYGYAQTTVKAIAEEVGITSGAVYHYYPSKQALLEVLSVALITEAVTRLRGAAERHTDFVGRISAVFDELDVVHREQPELAGFTLVLTGDVARYAELRIAYEACLDLYNELCRWLIDEAVASGELAPDIDRQSMVDMLHATITGIISTLSRVRPEHYGSIIDTAKRLFAGTLFVRS